MNKIEETPFDIGVPGAVDPSPLGPGGCRVAAGPPGRGGEGRRTFQSEMRRAARQSVWKARCWSGVGRPRGPRGVAYPSSRSSWGGGGGRGGGGNSGRNVGGWGTGGTRGGEGD